MLSITLLAVLPRTLRDDVILLLDITIISQFFSSDRSNYLSSTGLPVRISYDTLFMPASLHSLILSSSICFTPPSRVFRKSCFAFSKGVSGFMNARSALGGMISCSITLSTNNLGSRYFR